MDKTKHLTKDMLREWGYDDDEIDEEFEDYDESEKSEMSRELYEIWKRRFKTIFRKLNATDRIGLGHDASIFLHTAKSSGMVGGKLFAHTRTYARRHDFTHLHSFLVYIMLKTNIHI